MLQATTAYFNQQLNKQLTALNAAYQQKATLQAQQYALERVMSANVIEPTRDLVTPLGIDFSVTDSPSIQLVNTRGYEQYNVKLPTRQAVRTAWVQYFTGVTFNPVDTTSINAYYGGTNGVLPSFGGSSSGNTSLVYNQTLAEQTRVAAEIAEGVSEPFSDFLQTIRVIDPIFNERLERLAWAAGDGRQRQRDLLGYTLSALLLNRENDDYSTFGQVLTRERSKLRNPTTPIVNDTIQSQLDEIVGAIAPDTDNCHPTVNVASNEANIAVSLRAQPTLYSTAGVSNTILSLNTNSVNPDLVHELTTELNTKGTTTDSVFTNLSTAATSLASYSITNTSSLFTVEGQLNTVLAYLEAQQGPAAAANFRAIAALYYDTTLDYFQRSAMLKQLGELLIPAAHTADYTEFWLETQILATRKPIDCHLVEDVVTNIVAFLPSTDIPAIAAIVVPALGTVPTIFGANFLTNIYVMLQKIIQIDMGMTGSRLTSADLATLTSVTQFYGHTPAYSPEDFLTQQQRLQDIASRMQPASNIPNWNYGCEILFSPYLAQSDKQNLANTLAIKLQPLSPLDALWIQFLAGEAISEPILGEIISSLELFTNDNSLIPLIDNLSDNPDELQRRAMAADLAYKYSLALRDPVSWYVEGFAIQCSTQALNLSNHDQLVTLGTSYLNSLQLQLGTTQYQQALALFQALCGQVPSASYVTNYNNALTAFIGSNTTLHTYVNNLTSSIQNANQSLISQSHFTSPADLQYITDVVSFAVQGAINNGDYLYGKSVIAINNSLQKGTVLSNFGTGITLTNISPSVDYNQRFNNGAIKVYYATHITDPLNTVINNTPTVYHNGDFPLTVISTTRSTSSTPINNFQSNAGTAAGQNSITNSISSLSGLTSGLANILCKSDILFNLINQLNGAVSSITGELVGGINNAIGQINSAISGAVGQVTSLISSIGNLGTLNLNVSCACLSFNLNFNLQALIPAIPSWLTSFSIPTISIQIPALLSPQLGCPNQMLNGLNPGGTSSN